MAALQIHEPNRHHTTFVIASAAWRSMTLVWMVDRFAARQGLRPCG